MAHARLILSLLLLGCAVVGFAAGHWPVWPVAALATLAALGTLWSARHARHINAWLVSGFSAFVVAALYMQTASHRTWELPALGPAALITSLAGNVLMRIGRRR